MIVQLIGGAPSVFAHRKKVAIHEKVDGEDHGFLLKPDAAVATATRILATVADIGGREACTLPVESIELTGGFVVDQERYARLVLTTLGAPLCLEINATQVAELAAGFTAAARALDAPMRPRDDG